MLSSLTFIVFQSAMILAMARKRAGHFRMLEEVRLDNDAWMLFSLTLMGTNTLTG